MNGDLGREPDMHDDLGSEPFRAGEAPLHAEISPPPRKSAKRNAILVLILLSIAFVGGIFATLWVGPGLQRWVHRIQDEEFIGQDNAGGATGNDQAASTDAPGPPVNSMNVASLEARMAALSAKLDAISTQANDAGGNAARAEGILIAFATRRALDRGAALGYLEGELRLRFGESQPRAVTTIINAANAPVTLANLQAGLDEVTPGLIGTQEKRDWWTATKQELANLIIIRKSSQPSSVPQKAIERAKMMLWAQRVDNAVEEIEKLPDHQDADEWLQMARRYNEARRALDVIEAAAILEPRAVAANARPAGAANIQAAPPPPAVRTVPDSQLQQ
jgi:hypothetical protein